MMMLRQIYGNTRQKNIFRNDNLRESVEVAPKVENIVKTRVRWFDQVKRKSMDFVVKRVDQVEGGKITVYRGRERKPIREPIKKDLEINAFSKNMVYYWNYRNTSLLSLLFFFL